MAEKPPARTLVYRRIRYRLDDYDMTQAAAKKRAQEWGYKGKLTLVEYQPNGKYAVYFKG